MKVSSGSGQTLMAHEDLNDSEILPLVEKKSRKRMTKGMGPHTVCLDACLSEIAFNQTPNSSWSDSSITT